MLLVGRDTRAQTDLKPFSVFFLAGTIHSYGVDLQSVWLRVSSRTRFLMGSLLLQVPFCALIQNLTAP